MYRTKRIPKLGDSLRGTVERKFLWRAIDAGRVGKTFEELSGSLKELKGSQMVSWRAGVLKIKVSSPVQRQELFYKLEKIKAAMKEKGVEVKEIKILL